MYADTQVLLFFFLFLFLLLDGVTVRQGFANGTLDPAILKVRFCPLSFGEGRKEDSSFSKQKRITRDSIFWTIIHDLLISEARMGWWPGSTHVPWRVISEINCTPRCLRPPQRVPVERRGFHRIRSPGPLCDENIGQTELEVDWSI